MKKIYCDAFSMRKYLLNCEKFCISKFLSLLKEIFARFFFKFLVENLSFILNFYESNVSIKILFLLLKI